MMSATVHRRSSSSSTAGMFQPPSSDSPHQSEGVYSNASANSSVLAIEDLGPSSTGSEVDLLPGRNGEANVEMPPLTLQLSDRRIPGSRSGTLVSAIPNPERPRLQNEPFSRTSPQENLEEWKSWKTKYPWLSFLLVITISIIATILTLDNVSRRNNGFAPLASAPKFLARDPAVEQAIWAQGLLYTSFPALIMTIYRTMFDSTVTAFADRQPFVDLKKEQGRPAKSTIMLDYKTEPALWVYITAFQNKHYLLGLCLLASVLVGLLVVPLVAFLFTTASFALNTTLPLSISTTFDPNAVFYNFPDLRLSLNSAAAIRLQDALGPPWTDGEFAFSKFIPLRSVGNGNVTIQTTGYSSYIDCEYIPESDYTKLVVPPGAPGGTRRDTTIQIKANDRGCGINGEISVTTVADWPPFPDIPGFPPLKTLDTTLTMWPTLDCSADSGWSRLSMMTAKFVNSSTGITDFSLISCIPSYKITPGTLIAISASSELSLNTFAPQLSNVTAFRSDVLSKFLEPNIEDFECFDKLRYVKGDEFMRYVYSVAARRYPDSPLVPEAIIDAASTMWSTTFAVLASTELFQPMNSPINATGVYSRGVNRLVVVSPIAYIIISVLIVVSLLIISLFFYTVQESILLEEPVGLVSAAGILHKSAVNEVVDELVNGQGFDGKVTAAMKREDELMIDRYRFDEKQKRIVCYKGVGIPRKSWWKSLIEWMGGTLASNTLLSKLRRR